MIEQFTLLPGAEVIAADERGQRRHAQFGVPPCIKLWFQRRLPPPTTFVLPHRFFHRGVVQVSLEFFLYYFLFAVGKAYGKVPESERLVVVGTPAQLARCRRSLQVSLMGFDENEMRSWTGGAPLSEEEIRFIHDCQLFLAPKRPGFDALREFLETTPDLAGATLPANAPALLTEFLASAPAGDANEVRRAAYALARIDLEEAVEWRAFDAHGRAALFEGVDVEHCGHGSFVVREAASGTVLEVSTDFEEDQAPWLVTLPPASEAVASDVFKVLCLGADPGFEMEHPTTGFAFCLNGMWAVVDAPLCASYLLARHGVDPADVRVVFETHGHEDHMGSGIHFMLECLTSGRPYTYVAAEPVYRTCVVKVAAILDIDETEADALLNGRDRRGDARTRVMRVSPRVPFRLLGATWQLYWMIHPVATTGFRIELDHNGRPWVVSFSSDTAPLGGRLGVEAMRAQGFLPPDVDPYGPLLQGDEDLVFFEAGGTAGDPIHFDANDWDRVCRERGVSPTTVFMHAHPLPPSMRSYSLARPGMSWTLASLDAVAPPLFLKLVNALATFELDDPPYWLWMFASQGRLEKYYPGAAVPTGSVDDDTWFVVLQGQAEVRFEPDGTGTMLRSSAFFGHIGVQEGNACTVRATSHLDVWRVPGEVFREFVVGNGLIEYFSNLWANVGRLRQSRLFLGFPHQVLADLARRGTRREYAAGETLIVAGERGHEMYVLLEGEVEVEVEIDREQRRERFRRGPGEILGEYGVLVPGARRSATVRAADKVTVLVITRQIIDEIVAGQIPLLLRLARILEDRADTLPPVTKGLPIRNGC